MIRIPIGTQQREVFMLSEKVHETYFKVTLHFFRKAARRRIASRFVDAILLDQPQTLSSFRLLLVQKHSHVLPPMLHQLFLHPFEPTLFN